MIPPQVIKSFEQEPFEFDFVQLIRLLYLYQDGSDLNQKLVGFENAPLDEVVRFKTSARMRHTSADVCKIEQLPNGRYSVEISFLGLIGAAGVLPHHYSRTVLDRLKENDHSMKSFFDLFHHRIVSNFFRASVKYRLPFQHELFSRFRSDPKGDRPSRAIEKDAIGRSISCAVGLADTVQDRLDIDDRNRLFYGGNFSNSRPTLTGLTRMLGEFARMDVKVLQFQFEWLYLDPNDQTDLGNPGKRLGENVVIGNRVGSIQNRFRVRLGPLSWRQFLKMLPSQERLKQIAQFTRAYVGIGFDFDFQLVLNGSEVPCMQLGNEECGLLGWNTWITASSLQGEIQDAVFDVESIDDKFNSG